MKIAKFLQDYFTSVLEALVNEFLFYFLLMSAKINTKKFLVIEKREEKYHFTPEDHVHDMC